ncbi:hypothetical protein GA0061102_100811 [Rhizobium miluonense]|uniref:Uncharacterized protein n=2 Tax=Rhizobium miluonense TaxID=411945 RepID=A0A1C3V1Q7_9HYPH|nr:hypothetical protein GA0061102_100811 [Rhizobium miluonense]
MYQYVAEAFVAVANAPLVADKICTRIAGFSIAIGTEGSDRLLTFKDGCANIRLTADGLFFRVSARDLVTVYGIRTLIEGSLWKFASSSARSIKWLLAKGIPFRAVDKRLTYGHGRMKKP